MNTLLQTAASDFRRFLAVILSTWSSFTYATRLTCSASVMAKPVLKLSAAFSETPSSSSLYLGKFKNYSADDNEVTSASSPCCFYILYPTLDLEYLTAVVD